MAPVPAYEVVNVAIPRQRDGISCGPIVCAAAYYQAIYGRWPTYADFEGNDHYTLRAVILDVLTTGVLRIPDNHVVPAAPAIEIDIDNHEIELDDDDPMAGISAEEQKAIEESIKEVRRQEVEARRKGFSKYEAEVLGLETPF